MSLEGFAERVKVEGLRDSEVEGMETISLYHLKQNIKRRREETRRAAGEEQEGGGDTGVE